MNPHEDAGLSDAIRDRATRHEAPPALRDRLAAALNRPDPLPAAAPRSRLRASWLRPWAGMGAAFAVGVFVSLTFVSYQASLREENNLVQEVVDGHVRSLMASHLADVASSDQHTVKPWFGGKLDFSPPVPDLAGEGFPLVGGRLDYLDLRPVAALVYRRQQHIINLFVWPSGGAATQAVKSQSRQGFNTAEWNDSGMRFWAVSDLNASELHAFAQLLRRHDAK